MKIILLGMLIIFLLGMTAQLVVYTIMAYIKEDCSRKMMRTVFVKNTILRYEECTKLGIPVDNVKRFVENTFDSCIYGGYSPYLIADVSKKSGNIIMVMGILSVIFHINNLQECFVYISMTLLEVIALRVSEKMTDYNENKKNIIIIMQNELLHFEKYSELLKENVRGIYTEKLRGQAAAEFGRLNKQYKQILKNT